MKKFKVTPTRYKFVIAITLTILLAGASSFLKAEKVEKKEHSGKGYLGVNIQRMSHDDKEEFGVKFGVLVIKVVKDDAADKAGIKKYDVIQYFNEDRIRLPQDLSQAVRNSKPGEKVTLKIVRDNKEKAVSAVLGEISEDRFFASRGEGPFFWHGDKKEWKDDENVFRYRFKDGDKEKEHVFFRRFGGVFMGVQLNSISDTMGAYFGVKADGGALVVDVEKDSPAEKAGLKEGDVITRIEGKDVSRPEDVIKLLVEKKKDDKVEIQVLRHKKKETMKVTLEEQKNFPSIHMMEGGMKDFDVRMPRWHMHMDGPMILGEDEEDVVIHEGMPGNKMDRKRIKIKKHMDDFDPKCDDKDKKLKKIKVIKENTYI